MQEDETRTSVRNNYVQLAGDSFNLGDGRLVVSFVPRREFNSVDVGVLGHEAFQRLSSGVTSAGENYGVGSRCDGGGERISKATVCSGNCIKIRGLNFIELGSG